MNQRFLKRYSKYSFLVFSLLILLLALYIVMPFLTSIIASAIIVYVFYPIFKRANKVVKNKGLSAFLMILLILMIIIIPSFFVIKLLVIEVNTIEADSFYQFIKRIDLTFLSDWVSKFAGENIDINLYIQDIVGEAVSFIWGTASDFLFSIPEKILILFVSLFVMYYLFKDADKFLQLFEKIFPLRSEHKNEILGEFNKVIYATIYGVLISALIQGMIGTAGLIVFDVQSPLMWGVLMTVTAMIPLFGTALIWFPIALFKIFTGDYVNGFGLMIYGIVIISTIDNFIKPKLISNKSKIHPVLIILGVFGGLKMFGLVGIMIGPLILSLLPSLYKFYFTRVKK